MQHDVIIRRGTVVDGTGRPARRADVAIDGDRVTRVVELHDGGLDATGAREIEAEGRLVTPGFVDIHTHLDAQIVWDPTAHVVLTGTASPPSVMGNCGVTFAPLPVRRRPSRTWPR